MEVKQLKILRERTRYKALPRVALFASILLVLITAINILHLFLNILPDGYTLKQLVVMALTKFVPDKTYLGSELLAIEHTKKTLVFILITAISFMLYVLAKRQYRKDVLLLNLIDKDKQNG